MAVAVAVAVAASRLSSRRNIIEAKILTRNAQHLRQEATATSAHAKFVALPDVYRADATAIPITVQCVAMQCSPASWLANWLTGLFACQAHGATVRRCAGSFMKAAEIESFAPKVDRLAIAVTLATGRWPRYRPLPSPAQHRPSTAQPSRLAD